MKTFKTMIGGGAVAALTVGAMLAGGAPAQAQGISGVTNCGAPGGKQEVGALLGGLLGGVIGNKVGGRHATGETVVGAVAGAAAGSAIGCKMQHNRQNAAGVYSQGGYRLSNQIAPASYRKIGETFVATRTVNLRSAPTNDGARVGALRAGDRFEALAEVPGSPWILVGDGGVGVGYVHADYVRPSGYRYASR